MSEKSAIEQRQEMLLAAEDWRYFAIDKVGTGLGAIATEEHVPELGVVSFGLPSASALYLSIARTSYLKRAAVNVGALFDKHPTGVWPNNQTPLFDFFEALLCEIVFSIGAIEAFVNESIPASFVYSYKPSNREEPVKLDKDDVERRVPLEEKLKIVLPSALGIKGPSGTKVWERFKKLKSLRDRLTHLKSLDRKSSGPEEQTVWGAMLQTHDPYPDVAIDVIEFFIVGGRRWFSKYERLKR